jgi:hypothetical protein
MRDGFIYGHGRLGQLGSEMILHGIEILKTWSHWISGGSGFWDNIYENSACGSQSLIAMSEIQDCKNAEH